MLQSKANATDEPIAVRKGLSGALRLRFARQRMRSLLSLVRQPSSTVLGVETEEHLQVLPYYMQGDQQFERKSQMDQRASLRSELAIHKLLQIWWLTAVNSEMEMQQIGGSWGKRLRFVVSREHFIRISNKLYRALVNEWDEEDAHKVAEAEWAEEMGEGTEYIGEESYMNSIFQIADQWTRGLTVAEYVNFLWILHSHVAEGSTPISSVWLADECVTYCGDLLDAPLDSIDVPSGLMDALNFLTSEDIDRLSKRCSESRSSSRQSRVSVLTSSRASVQSRRSRVSFRSSSESRPSYRNSHLKSLDQEWDSLDRQSRESATSQQQDKEEAGTLDTRREIPASMMPRSTSKGNGGWLSRLSGKGNGGLLSRLSGFGQNMRDASGRASAHHSAASSASVDNKAGSSHNGLQVDWAKGVLSRMLHRRALAKVAAQPAIAASVDANAKRNELPSTNTASLVDGDAASRSTLARGLVGLTMNRHRPKTRQELAREQLPTTTLAAKAAATDKTGKGTARAKFRAPIWSAKAVAAPAPRVYTPAILTGKSRRP